ncbi:hypothetical protein ACHWQZ_G013423 [Mnemiopsis leidyi]
MGLTETQNLTVVLRVRPPNEPHVGKDRIVHVLDGQMVILTDPRDEDDILRAKRSKEKRYMFDIAFDSYNTQLDVYLATTKPLISSVLDGFNATVFAYGPTGTGKTYTMLGTGDNPGIMALAINEIFALVRKGAENSTYTVYMSYLEVYNEMIRDLLCPESGDLELREDSTGVSVAGLTVVEAQSTREVMDMLRDGNTRRTTEPTSVNKTSSRSHAVLQVTVKRLGRARSLTETISIGKLYMIDLAGSERATHTKNRGTRLVEGAHINRSLLALGNCIKALSDSSSSYVNYRDSKLTRLLKDSLGGNCRTAMIAHVSPDAHVFDESRNTLQYADRAKRIKTKIRPNLQTVSHHIAKYPIIVEELHKEIARLKQANKSSDSHSLESESGILPVKDRELLESKRAQLGRAFNKQLKNRERLCRLEGQQKIGGHKTGHLQGLLLQHQESHSLYSVLPPIAPSSQPLPPSSPSLPPSSSHPSLPSSSSQLEIEAKEIEIKSALRRHSARKRRGEGTREKLLRSSSRLAEKYRAIEEDIEEKIVDTDHREILGLVSNVHALELQLVAQREEVQCLSTVVEEQGHYINSQQQYNVQLLEVVRTQQELLTANNIPNTPRLDTLYHRLQERSIAEYSVLPRIGSAVSSIGEDSGDEDSEPPTTPPHSDHTPVFTKTYNVMGKEDGGVSGMIIKLEERDPSQTTIHVLSTPSLTGGRETPTRTTPRGGDVTPRDVNRGEESHVTSLVKVSELAPSLPQTGSSPAPGKQAKKAIQLQRLRTLKTEPVLSTTPKQKPRGKNIKPLNKTHVKSDTNMKMAEKARIYGGPANARTPQTRGKRQGGHQRKTNNPNLSVTGTNRNFPMKVFR